MICRAAALDPVPAPGADHRDLHFVLPSSRITNRSPFQSSTAKRSTIRWGLFDCLGVVGANHRFEANEMATVIDDVSPIFYHP